MVAFVFRLPCHLINIEEEDIFLGLPSRNMGLAYNAGNEQYYYKNYRSSPGDNIMQSNSFNPYFIKSELLVY